MQILITHWLLTDFDNSNFIHSFAPSKSIPLKQSNYLIFKILSVMSNLKTYFKNVVSVCKKGFAYVKVVPVLIKAVYQRLVGNGYYEVAFTKIGRKWYSTRFPKYFLSSKLFIAIKFLIRHIFKYI